MIFLKKIIFKLAKPFIKLFSTRDAWEENIFYCKRKIFGDECVIANAKMKFIDKNLVNINLNSPNLVYDINDTAKKPGLIVSLTSYPERSDEVRYAIFSLLQQTVKPEKIILWLASEEYPDGAESLLTEFGDADLTVKFCRNIKSYKKLIPALEMYPDSVIVTADDDIFYEPDWLERLVDAYQKNPQYIHCHKSHLIRLDENGAPLPYRKWKAMSDNTEAKASYMNFSIGCGGVLYPPHTLYQDVCRDELFMKLAPLADDIWFWAMAVKQGTKINFIKNSISEVTYVNPAVELGIDGVPLWRLNVGRGLNDKQLQAILAQYNLIEKLQCS